jgi:hypothetical protein
MSSGHTLSSKNSPSYYPTPSSANKPLESRIIYLQKAQTLDSVKNPEASNQILVSVSQHQSNVKNENSDLDTTQQQDFIELAGSSKNVSTKKLSSFVQDKSDYRIISKAHLKNATSQDVN